MILPPLKVGAVLLIGASLTLCQDLLPGQNAQEKGSNHLLWVIPNCRTSPSPTDSRPVAVHEKFKLAAEDSWDRGTVALSALFAVQAQAAIRTGPSDKERSDMLNISEHCMETL